MVVEIPLADAGSLTTGPSADSQVGFELGRLPKANWRIRRPNRCSFSLSLILISLSIFGPHHCLFHGAGWHSCAPIQCAYTSLFSVAIWDEHAADPNKHLERVSCSTVRRKGPFQNENIFGWIQGLRFASKIDCVHRKFLSPFKLRSMDQRCMFIILVCKDLSRRDMYLY